MKHIALIIIGICIVLVGIATAFTFTDFSAPKTYSMSINDMKSVQGGDNYYQDYKCIYTTVGTCYPTSCTKLVYSLCYSGYPEHLCIATGVEQIRCQGVDCNPGAFTEPYGPCVSYPD